MRVDNDRMKHRNGGEQRDYNERWTHNGNKFVIGTIHGAPIEVVAQYNPKELARQAAATWNPHPNTSAKYASTGESQMWSEYRTTAPRTLTVELLFDGYEEGISIAPIVEDLERLTIPVDMSSRDESKRRPQLCVAVWGQQQLRCVVTSVATKLTMFDDAGAPLRATCTVVLTEVDVVAMMKSDVHGAIDRVAKKSGSLPSTKPGHEWPYPPEDSKPTRVPPPNRTQEPPPAKASAPAAAPAKTVGTPSKQINPAALEGNGPSSDQLFLDDPPAAAPAPDAVSSADGGTADPKYKAAAEDLE